jgi:hypothetical protein
MPTLTKMDVAALRKGDVLCVHLTSQYPKGLMRVIKHANRNEANPFAQDQEHIIDAPVTLNGFNGRAEIESGRAKCFGHVTFYHGQHTPAPCIVQTLREGDDITFRFYPDAHTNGYVSKAGLPGDVLYLDVRRGDKRFSWELENSICPDNTARMCQGIPLRD